MQYDTLDEGNGLDANSQEIEQAEGSFRNDGIIKLTIKTFRSTDMQTYFYCSMAMPLM